MESDFIQYTVLKKNQALVAVASPLTHFQIVYTHNCPVASKI